MIFSWLTNLIIGIFGFLLVFLLSIKTNTLGTSFIRSLIALLLFYLIGFVVRWVIRYVLTDTINIDTDITLQNQAIENNNLETDKLVNEEKQNPHSKSGYVKNESNETLESSFEGDGDVYERTSQFVRELLNEKE